MQQHNILLVMYIVSACTLCAQSMQAFQRASSMWQKKLCRRHRVRLICFAGGPLPCCELFWILHEGFEGHDREYGAQYALWRCMPAVMHSSCMYRLLCTALVARLLGNSSSLNPFSNAGSLAVHWVDASMKPLQKLFRVCYFRG